ncbi:MAG: C39 family peptidase [Elusimicrobia bacterium]|nr:C39 family peptidase [Elusimicrobiota bacterium]
MSRNFPLRPSHTVVHASPAEFTSAKLQDIRLPDFSRGLFTLATKKTGWIESNPVEALYPFHELIASGNADLPPGTAFALEIQVRFSTGTWSPWYRMGRFSSQGGESFPGQEDAKAKVDIDTLKLKEPADAFRYRVTLERTQGTKSPVLRLVAVTYTDRSQKQGLGVSGSGTAAHGQAVPNPQPRDLKVPLRSQMSEQPKYKHDICSPTSLGMVLTYWKEKISTMKATRGVYDRAEKIYGNWFFNTAYAGALGFEAYVVRFNSLEELESEVRSGRPTVISLSFEPGELSGAPIRRTRGHLLVVRGFEANGDVIVNDPAAPKVSEVRRVYKREEFERAWLRNKAGVAYRISAVWPKRMVVAVPFTHLRRDPKPLSSKNSSRDSLQESQILLGEKVRVFRIWKDWAEVQAMEQENWEKHTGWRPYPGWVRLQDLVFQGQMPATNAVVREKSALLQIKEKGSPKEEVWKLSVGTRLHVMEERQGESRVFLPGSREGLISSQSLLEFKKEPEFVKRDLVLEMARLFLGDAYFWGGRTAAEDPGLGGVDCSGLVSLAYRVIGVDVPRNAQDQYRKSRHLKREELKDGDLLFLSEKNSPNKINHVMIYSGKGRIIEASGELNQVREISAEQKFKKPFDQLQSGDILERRTLYFGTFF